MVRAGRVVTDALAGPGGEVPTRLRPLADGLVSMHRPQSGVAWLRRSAIARETLRDLAQDRMPCSHAALDGAGADRAVEYLRSLLVRYGALPPRDRRLADFQRWAAAKRLKLGADWLDVPEPVATLLRQHLRNRTNMTTAANPASPWLFPGQLAGEHRSYRRLVRVLHQLGIPARASRLAAWRELVRNAPPAVLADALGVSPGTAMRHAFLGGADWSAYAARRRAHTPDDKTS